MITSFAMRDRDPLPEMESGSSIKRPECRQWAVTGHNNIFRDGQRHGYSESAIGDDARTIRARMPSFKKT
jgi:hypothetical protein